MFGIVLRFTLLWIIYITLGFGPVGLLLSIGGWRYRYICPPKLNYNHAKGWVFTDCGQLANSLQQYLHSCGIIAACPMCSDSAVTSFVKLLRFCEDTQPSPAQPRQPSTIEIESPSCCHIVNIIWKTPSWSRSCRWRCLREPVKKKLGGVRTGSFFNFFQKKIISCV